MTFVLPEGLAPEVYPLAWLVGSWQGEGVLGYPGVEESAFTAHVRVTSDGGPYLSWTSRLHLAGDDDAPAWAAETGWWRVPPSSDDTLPEGQHPVELLVADASGHVGVYVGQVGAGRIETVSDLVARTETGAQVTAGRRLLGLVSGELMWAFDLAAFGHPLQSYASARMRRVD
ncbi:MAG: FABP family protein [Micrococcales bacterium]|nr:FABP family protein [Micrococcales bacterium]